MAAAPATQLMQVTMPTGEVLWVETRVSSAVRDTSRQSQERMLGRLERLDETIRGVVRSVGTAVARHAPAETELEFGLEIAVETGKAVAVLAGAHATASVKVKLRWNRGEFPADEAPEPDEAG